MAASRPARRLSLAVVVGAVLLLLLGVGAQADGAVGRGDGEETTTTSSSSTTTTYPYTLFHRTLSTSTGDSPPSAWESRALIVLTERSSALEPDAPPSASYQDLLLPSSTSPSSGPLGGAQRGGDLYQLILVPGTGAQAAQAAAEGRGAMTSLKQCHLVSTSTTPKLHDDLELRFSPSSSSPRKPIALSYRVPGLVLGPDACPLPPVGPHAKRWTEIEGIETAVRVVSPVLAPEPPLRAPIPVKQDGTPETPPPEKSFLQKYWMYLVPVLILMFIPAEAEHAGSAEHDSSSNWPPPRELAAQRIK